MYDASAKSDGASLNDCLHAGPALTQSIFDIMLSFRNHRVALMGDIEKAFLMVHMNETDKDDGHDGLTTMIRLNPRL